jgi:hypothetical protein
MGVEQVQPQDQTATDVDGGDADLERQRAAQQPAAQHEQRRGGWARPPGVQVGHHAEERDHNRIVAHTRSSGPATSAGRRVTVTSWVRPPRTTW